MNRDEVNEISQRAGIPPLRPIPFPAGRREEAEAADRAARLALAVEEAAARIALQSVPSPPATSPLLVSMTVLQQSVAVNWSRWLRSRVGLPEVPG